MQPNRKAPATNEGHSEKHRAGAESILLPTVADLPEQIRLSDKAETALCRIAYEFGTGQLDWWQLSPGLYELVLRAWFLGRESRDGEVANLSALADRHYLRAYNSPEKIREIHRRAIDGAAAESARRFFGEVSA